MGEIWLSLLISIIIGAFIGWITNLIAVKALFRPYKKYSICGIDYQGLIPKRRAELADNLGNMVEGELINIQELMDKVNPEDVSSFIERTVDNHEQEITSTIQGYVDNFKNHNQRLIDSVKTASKWFGRDLDAYEKELVSDLTGIACRELKKKAKEASPKIIKTAGEEIVKHISVHDLVKEKVDAMNLEALEAMVDRIASREMKMIEVLGGILGAVVGALQWAVQHYLIS